MTKKTVFALVVLWGVLISTSATAQDFPRLLKFLQDRLNRTHLDAVLGAVDYDLAYAPRLTRHPNIVLLETPPPLPDSLQRVVSDTIPSWRKLMPTKISPVKTTKASRLRREDLPADLRQADIATLRANLPWSPRMPEETGYLAAWKASGTYWFPDERLTLAESELSVMERRQWRWKAREVFRHKPFGSILLLHAGKPVASGQGFELPVQWSFRRPNRLSWETLTSGEVTLTFQKVDGVWKASHIEQLIAALYERVIE